MALKEGSRMGHWRGAVLLGILGYLAAVPEDVQAQAHDWGPLTGAVSSTTVVTHDQLNVLAEAANDFGMNAPDVAGSAGQTTIDGVPAFVFSLPGTPNSEYDGFCAGGAPGIAFNANDWHPSQFNGGAAWLDESLAIKWTSTAYHELAHHIFKAHLKTWCEAHPADCMAYAACTASQASKLDPCGEAYANGTAVAKLCADIASICANPDLLAAEKSRRVALIKPEVDAQVKDCTEATAACNACPTHPPMPAGFAGCGPPAGCHC